MVGAGPNGLAAAITLARAGVSVDLVEGADRVGGGLRSAELTLPGFVHDPCATIVGTSLISPFFRGLDLARYGVDYALPEVPLAHAFAGSPAAILERSVDGTAARLGADAAAYRRIMGTLVRDADRLVPWVFGPIVRVPRHPVVQARFGIAALLPVELLGRLAFRGDAAPALLAGLSAHAVVRLDRLGTASFGLVLAMSAHLTGWPVVRGGSGRLAEALAAELRSLGGRIRLGTTVRTLRELEPARAILLDVSARSAARIVGDELPSGYRRRLERFRYGPGVCKVDWALDGPIPWRDPDLARAGTVHLAGTAAEVVAAERVPHRGRVAGEPFVLVVQPTVFDPTRAPAGKHTAWAYCHVPNGWAGDASERIEDRIERFAPGFRDLVLARSVRTAADVGAYDPNCVGGDINAGSQDLGQLLARPVPARDPYRMPRRGVYLCSSSTPPGGGAHGMSGYLAARSALRHEFGVA